MRHPTLLTLTLALCLHTTPCHAVSYHVSYYVTLDTTPLANRPTLDSSYAYLAYYDEGQELTAIDIRIDDVSIPLGRYTQGFVPSATDPLSFLLTVDATSDPFALGFPGEFSFGIVYGADGPYADVPSSAFRFYAGYDGVTVFPGRSLVQIPGNCEGCFDTIELPAPIFAIVGEAMVTPEPSSLLLMLSGFLACVFWRRR